MNGRWQQTPEGIDDTPNRVPAQLWLIDGVDHSNAVYNQMDASSSELQVRFVYMCTWRTIVCVVMLAGK